MSELITLARAACDDPFTRELADQVEAPCYDDSEAHVQYYWQGIARALLAELPLKEWREALEWIIERETSATDQADREYMAGQARTALSSIDKLIGDR